MCFIQAYASATSDWQVMLVADVPPVITSEEVPARTNLVDKNCGKEKKALVLSVSLGPINSCGTTVKVLLLTNV